MDNNNDCGCEDATIIPINTDAELSQRLNSDDPQIRIEAKLDVLVELLQDISNGMGSAMEQLQDSPLGKMIGRLVGASD